MLQLNAYRGEADPHDPLLSPLYADLRGLPPLLVQAGEGELLRSDAERLAALATQAGVPTTLDIWPGMWHYWHHFVPFLPEARQAMQVIAQFLHACFEASDSGYLD
jgi:acetyl esterase/lipase